MFFFLQSFSRAHLFFDSLKGLCSWIVRCFLISLEMVVGSFLNCRAMLRMELPWSNPFSIMIRWSIVICFWVPGIDLHISTSFLLRIEGTKIIKDMEEESKTKFSMNVEFSFSFKTFFKKARNRETKPKVICYTVSKLSNKIYKESRLFLCH